MYLQKIFPHKPRLIEKWRKKTDGKKRFQALKNVLMSEPCKGELQNV